MLNKQAPAADYQHGSWLLIHAVYLCSSPIPTCSLVLCSLLASPCCSCSNSPTQGTSLTHPVILLFFLLCFSLALALGLPPVFLWELSPLYLTGTTLSVIPLKLLLSSPKSFAFQLFQVSQVALSVVRFFHPVLPNSPVQAAALVWCSLFSFISITCLYLVFLPLRYHPEPSSLVTRYLASSRLLALLAHQINNPTFGTTLLSSLPAPDPFNSFEISMSTVRILWLLLSLYSSLVFT